MQQSASVKAIVTDVIDADLAAGCPSSHANEERLPAAALIMGCFTGLCVAVACHASSAASCGPPTHRGGMRLLPCDDDGGGDGHDEDEDAGIAGTSDNDAKMMMKTPADAG